MTLIPYQVQPKTTATLTPASGPPLSCFSSVCQPILDLDLCVSLLVFGGTDNRRVFCFLQYAGLSLLRPLPLRSTGSGCAGSAAMAHGPIRSAACGIFPDQGTNPCPLHRQADSQPLRYQGSPVCLFLKSNFRFMAKLRGRYRDSPYTLCPHTCITSPIISIPHQGGTLL